MCYLNNGTLLSHQCNATFLQICSFEETNSKLYSRHPQSCPSPAEFSCNPNQTHLSMLISILMIIRKSQLVSLIRVGAKLCSRLDLQERFEEPWLLYIMGQQFFPFWLNYCVKEGTSKCLIVTLTLHPLKRRDDECSDLL